MGRPPGSVVDAVEAVSEFDRQARSASTHTAKQIVFATFLTKAFGVDLVDLLPGVEKKVGSRVLGVRGSIDQLFQGAIIEVKTSFEGELDDARAELKKYFQALEEATPGRRYIGLVTDLRFYQTFKPTIMKGTVSDVVPSSKRLTRSDFEPEELILWIDGILFSQDKVRPTAESLDTRFGPEAPAYDVAIETLTRLWSQVGNTPSSELKLRMWKRSMEIVYGASPGPQAFVADTYLSMIVRLLVRLRLEPDQPMNRSQARAVLSGAYFADRGITNLVEEDYFGWVLEPSIGDEILDLVIPFANTLRAFDMKLADEDLFKEIYQKVIASSSRHATGEFYTPRWLCEFTLETVLKVAARTPNDGVRVLDPACGSGSFLTAMIAKIISARRTAATPKTLNTILQQVQGMDINPLAVTIARANYLIALGELAKLGIEITIPVFVADSMKLPELAPTVYHGVKAFDLEVEDKHILIPKRVLRSGGNSTRALAILGDAVRSYALDPRPPAEKRNDSEATFSRQVEELVDREDLEVFVETLRTTLGLVDEGKDTIWPFVIANMYAPILLRESRFDIIVGNPPWLVLRSIRDPAYQEFLKKSVVEYRLGRLSDSELQTHLEMATLFFCRASDLYLRDGGRISFVMPVSVTSAARHHAAFNEFGVPKLHLDRVDSFEGVPAIFSLPPVVLTATLGTASRFPVPRSSWRGNLKGMRRNSSWEDVGTRLTPTLGEYTPSVEPEGESPYYSLFKAGASIFPRPFWFVDAVDSSAMGLSARKPLVQSSAESERVGKESWKDYRFEGRVDAEYVYCTLLGKDILPFGAMPYRALVLPFRIFRDGHRFQDSTELRKSGFPLVAAWLDRAEKAWAESRTKKSAINFPSVKDRLDQYSLLSGQNAGKRFVVLYNARGADACCYVVDRRNLPPLSLASVEVKPAGFVSDYTTYRYETSDEREALYLSAFLNSPRISAAVKPFQPRGAFGARDIGPRPFRLDLPTFRPNDSDHIEMSNLARSASDEVCLHRFTKSGFRSRREELRSLLKQTLRKIDDIIHKERMDRLAPDPRLTKSHKLGGQTEFASGGGLKGTASLGNWNGKEDS